MKQNHEFFPGLSITIEEIASEAKSAISMGSGTLEVYATPSMIALMEKASMMCVEKYLKDDETTVGGAVNIKHLKPTALGRIVICKSEIKEVSGARIEFGLEVHEEDKLIGTGFHTRFIINKTSFMNNL